MAKSKQNSLYICRECGLEQRRWSGKCDSCQAWNSLEERKLGPGTHNTNATRHAVKLGHAPMQLLAEQGLDEDRLQSTGLADLDLVLGGGLVPGSFVLVAGEPGVGKSTLLLEVARLMPGKIYYFSGEESEAQIANRARRLKISGDSLYVSRETNPEVIAERIRRDRPALAFVDSIQTMYRPGSQQVPGMAGQLKEAAMLLLEACKESGTPVIATGHITKEGNVAGPRMLEHMVDTVLYFESDRLNHFRLLRAIKNRFGPVGEVALFEMESGGLKSGRDLGAQAHLSDGAAPGRVLSVVREGSRCLAVEVQSLVSRSPFGPARRMAEGLDSRRLMLLAAVMEKFLKLRLAECDIFANLAGGLTSHEPALDLAVCAAIHSSYAELPWPAHMACLGEVGLSGEVRPVARLADRLTELARLGMTVVLVPVAGLERIDPPAGMQLPGIASITELSRYYGEK